MITQINSADCNVVIEISTKNLPVSGSWGCSVLPGCGSVSSCGGILPLWNSLDFGFTWGKTSTSSFENYVTQAPRISCKNIDEFCWISKSPSSQLFCLVVLQKQTCDFAQHCSLLPSLFRYWCVWKHFLWWRLMYSACLYNSSMWVQYKSWSNWKVDVKRQVNTPASHCSWVNELYPLVHLTEF